jgi:subtilisin family serine protease
VSEDIWRRDEAIRVAHEADYIVGKFRDKEIPVGYATNDDGDILYMYVKGQLLTREQFLGGVAGPEPTREAGTQRPKGVLDVLGGAGLPGTPPEIQIDRVIGDVVRLNLPGVIDVPDDDPRSVPNLLLRIERELGAGFATPNHVLTAATGPMGPCPATEPQEVYGPWQPYPAVCPGDGGAGVRIYVADTGLLEGAATDFPWLQDVKGELDPRFGPGDAIQPYDGHGTFVAGVIRCLAPKAEIYVANVFDIAGSEVESDIAIRLNGALAHGAEIIHLTIASPSRNNVPMIAIQAWLEQLSAYQGVVCVAAAGNNGNRLPCWPAAFDQVISVGALASDWCSRAYFSNFGGWVDVYAPGQNLVNAYATGTYTCVTAPFVDEKRTFSGMVQWSGTSFSTPIVTGLIATRMSCCDENGQEAAAALLAEARARVVPGVGPVLLPCCDDGERCRGDRGGCGCGAQRCGCGGERCGCGGERCRCGSCGCGEHHHRMPR